MLKNFLTKSIEDNLRPKVRISGADITNILQSRISNVIESMANGKKFGSTLYVSWLIIASHYSYQSWNRRVGYHILSYCSWWGWGQRAGLEVHFEDFGRGISPPTWMEQPYHWLFAYLGPYTINTWALQLRSFQSDVFMTWVSNTVWKLPQYIVSEKLRNNLRHVLSPCKAMALSSKPHEVIFGADTSNPQLLYPYCETQARLDPFR